MIRLTQRTLFHYAVSIEQAAEMVDLALHYQSKGVVAVDIAGDEMIPMHQLHIDAFKVITRDCSL